MTDTKTHPIDEIPTCPNGCDEDFLRVVSTNNELMRVMGRNCIGIYCSDCGFNRSEDMNVDYTLPIHKLKSVDEMVAEWCAAVAKAEGKNQ